MPGFLFKTIRNDAFSFWPDFVDSLVIGKDVELRPIPTVVRFGYTARLGRPDPETQKRKYEAIPNKGETGPQIQNRKPLWTPEQKKNSTRAQSMSYANFDVGYHPPAFGHGMEDRKECLLGIIIPTDEALIQRIMKYDAGTINRSYDRADKSKATQYIEKNVKSGTYMTSLSDLEKNGNKEYNEVMARIKHVNWNKNKPIMQIAIFSDNIESRLLAQVRALDIYYAVCSQREKNGMSTDAVQPPDIVFYDTLRHYTDQEQTADVKNCPENSKAFYLTKIINAKKENKTLTSQEISENAGELLKFSQHLLRKLIGEYFNNVLTQDFNAIGNIGRNELTAWLFGIRTKILTDGNLNAFKENLSIIDFLTSDIDILAKFIFLLPEDKKIQLLEHPRISSYIHKQNQCNLEKIASVATSYRGMMLQLQHSYRPILHLNNEYIDMMYDSFFGKLIENAKQNTDYEFILYYFFKKPEQVSKLLERAFITTVSYIKEDKRYDFLNLPFIAFNLSKYVTNSDQLIALLELMPDKRWEWIQHNPEILHLISNENDLERFANVLGGTKFCEIVCANEYIQGLYKNLAKEDKHHGILQHLAFTTESDLDANEKGVLKITLQVYRDRPATSFYKGSIFDRQGLEKQQLVQNFLDNKISFKDLVTKHDALSERANKWSLLHQKPYDESKDSALGKILTEVQKKSELPKKRIS